VKIIPRKASGGGAPAVSFIEGAFIVSFNEKAGAVRKDGLYILGDFTTKIEI